MTSEQVGYGIWRMHARRQNRWDKEAALEDVNTAWTSTTSTYNACALHHVTRTRLASRDTIAWGKHWAMLDHVDWSAHNMGDNKYYKAVWRQRRIDSVPLGNGDVASSVFEKSLAQIKTPLCVTRLKRSIKSNPNFMTTLGLWYNYVTICDNTLHADTN